ncbi:efflux RND transporter periplasmic adaptor subunit [Pseudoalteromonas fenneropenaei]|uniref:Efflux RND transporter periplasmic adaptor subunit n=1 Tax=Pseudoalteromonas fenneropenaei TaxID=1737459 RepID=A0ABV7CNV6_9GAMM
MEKIFHVVVTTLVLVLLTSCAFFIHTLNSEKATTAIPNSVTKTNVTSNTSNQTVYICPMHNHILDSHQSDCPICGMQLVARDNPLDTHARQVIVSASAQANIALATSPVERSTLWQYIETLGTVDYDKNRTLAVHSKANGWIEHLAVTTPGELIKKGQLLYKIYSPDLVAAQDYYLGIYKSKTVNKTLLERAHSRLILLGITQELITEIEKRGDSIDILPFFSPFDAIVSTMHIQQGAYVSTASQMMTLADASTMWMLVNVFEHQANWLNKGTWAEVDIPAIGKSRLEAKIEHIYPELDPVTRTLRLHLSVNNSDLKIKKNMLSNVRIYGGGKHNVLNVPVGAVIRTEHEQRVIVKDDQHHFSPRVVKVGITTQGRVEILAGLNEGEHVVTSGQFLIDSESNIREAIIKMARTDSGLQEN